MAILLSARQWFILIACWILLGMYLGWDLYSDHQIIDSQESQRLSSSTQIIDKNLQVQLVKIDHVLSTLRKELPLMLQRKDGKDRLHRRLVIMSDLMLGVRTLSILNANGIVIHANRDEIIGENFSGREYFQATVNNQNPTLLHLSPPFRTVLGVYSINVTKSILDSQGRFNGVVSATLDPDYFNTLLESVRYTPDTRASLNHEDGLIFLTMPRKASLEGMNLAKPGTFFTRFHESEKLESVNTGYLLSTGEERMIAQRHIKPAQINLEKSLDIAVSRDLTLIFASWHKEVIFRTIMFLTLVFITALSLFFFQRRQNAFKRFEAQQGADRKQAEILLLENRNNYRLLIDALPDTSVYFLDKDLRYLIVGGGELTQHNFDKSSMEGKTIYESLPQELISTYEPLLRKALNGIPTYDEIPYKDIIYIQQILPVRNINNEIIGVLAISLDITQRRKKEHEAIALREQLAQASKMESIGQLTAGIAHDFNNILGAMIGYAELSKHMLSVGNAKAVTHYQEEVLKAGSRAKELILQMLTFSRRTPEVLGGEAPLTILANIVNEISSLLHSSIPSSIEIKIRIEDANLNSHIQPVHLHQIILNLGVNARDAMEGVGKIEISLAQRQIENKLCSSCKTYFSGNYAQISVKDTGNGIPDPELQKIFEPFYTSKGVGKGTGMGLSVVHGLVHAQGGHILVETSLDIGSTFSIFLPLSESDATRIPQSADVIQTENLKGVRIMVVDDEAILTSLLREFLSAHDAIVESFTDPLLALETYSLHTDRFDLVISDVTMPGLSGTHFAEKLLKIKPDLPIILCSGYSEHINPDTSSTIGIAAFFKKPLILAELLKKIHFLINNRHS